MHAVNIKGKCTHAHTHASMHARTHVHTHSFNGTTQVSRYQEGKTNLDFTEGRDSEWQWHLLGHMQVCTSLRRQTTTPAPHHSVFYRPDALPAAQPTVSKHWRKATDTIFCWWIVPLPRGRGTAGDWTCIVVSHIYLDCRRQRWSQWTERKIGLQSTPCRLVSDQPRHLHPDRHQAPRHHRSRHLLTINWRCCCCYYSYSYTSTYHSDTVMQTLHRHFT